MRMTFLSRHISAIFAYVSLSSLRNQCASSINTVSNDSRSWRSSIFSREPRDSQWKSFARNQKSRNALSQLPGLSSPRSFGGAITMVLFPTICASMVPIYVFPRPTTSDMNTQPYSSMIFLALITASF